LAAATTGLWRGARDLVAGRPAGAGTEEFWALKDVSFEVEQGEVVGIIGRNGAGKSTLLKILSRITEPTEGRAVLRGRVGSLLEVGTGFHAELTGRENIYLSGAILGMRKAEIDRKFDEIVAFSGVEKFLDTPAKRYSSGMYVRLGFAVAAHLEPEILVIDEVLAVGDAEFQKRCLGKMSEVAKSGRTVLFVSHNMGAVKTLCERAILIDEGRVIADGSAVDVASRYLSESLSEDQSEGEVAWPDGQAGLGDETVRLRKVRLVSKQGTVQSTFDTEDPVRLEIRYEVRAELRGLRFIVTLATPDDIVAFASTDQTTQPGSLVPGQYRSVCTIPGALLNTGAYVVKVGFGIPRVRNILPATPILRLFMAGGRQRGSIKHEKWPGVVCPKLDWRVEPL
jgi:lipopolysaccharide transport system ATP-binding protein